MEKTKRQLRAEAVERLRYYPRWRERGETPHADPDLLMAVIGGESWGNTWNENRDALVALLTDDEPPEGDAVARLRDLPTFGAVRVDGGLDATNMPMVAATKGEVLEIADMIERDYVRREDYDAKRAEFSAMRDRAWGAEAERDCWRERCGMLLDAAQEVQRIGALVRPEGDGAPGLEVEP